jgi:HEAT repeat protein
LKALLGSARPELRQAVTIMCTSTQLLDNYGDELQVAWRLHIVRNEMNFRSQASDRPAFKALLTNTNASPYSRICAAYFLADSDPDARSLLTNYVASKNLRHRFNAALAVEWFAFDNQGEPRNWATSEMIKMLEERSLEIQYGTHTPSSGYEPNGYDINDDICTPLGKVIYTLGVVKERRAIPVLTNLIEGTGGDFYGAAYALGRIGDPSVAPLLLRMYGRDDSYSFGQALAMLQYRPAVPALLARLNIARNSYEAADILDQLAEISDPSSLPEVEKYVQSIPEKDEKLRKAGRRVLVQLREKDPVPLLSKMCDDETNEYERICLIRALGHYRDHRTIDKLFALAVNSDNTIYRRNALMALGGMEDKQALLALVSIVETNAPPPLEFDKNAILEGRPPDFSRKHAMSELRAATHLDFGSDTEKWRRWVGNSP